MNGSHSNVPDTGGKSAILILSYLKKFKIQVIELLDCCILCDLCRNILYISKLMHREHFPEKGDDFGYRRSVSHARIWLEG